MVLQSSSRSLHPCGRPPMVTPAKESRSCPATRIRSRLSDVTNLPDIRQQSSSCGRLDSPFFTASSGCSFLTVIVLAKALLACAPSGLTYPTTLSDTAQIQSVSFPLRRPGGSICAGQLAPSSLWSRIYIREVWRGVRQLLAGRD